MKHISWGIIGCGRVTEVKSGPAFNRINDSRLVAVMRRDGDKARDYARRHGVPKWTTDVDELIHDDTVNAIYVATPPGSHMEYTIRAAEAGKPVYVEKPMARTHEECQEMITACKKANVSLFVAYYRRQLPGFLKIKRLLENGKIGDIRLVTITLLYAAHLRTKPKQAELPWRVLPEIAGGGHFFDLAPHQLDYLDYLLGPISRATGIAANQAALYPAEDIVTASLEFRSGVLGTGRWCFTTPKQHETDRIEIIGSLGKITFPTFARIPVRIETSAGEEEFLPVVPQHIQEPLLETVVADLLGRGHCPSTGESAARTNWAMDEVLKQWRQEQMIDFRNT